MYIQTEIYKMQVQQDQLKLILIQGSSIARGSYILKPKGGKRCVMAKRIRLAKYTEGVEEALFKALKTAKAVENLDRCRAERAQRQRLEAWCLRRCCSVYCGSHCRMHSVAME